MTLAILSLTQSDKLFVLALLLLLGMAFWFLTVVRPRAKVWMKLHEQKLEHNELRVQAEMSAYREKTQAELEVIRSKITKPE